MKNSGKRILFLLPFTLGKAPSQRFRAEAYFDLLAENGYSTESRFFYNRGAWEILYSRGSVMQKGWLVMSGFLKRIWQVFFIVPRFDYVFVQREASPLGPPVFEWVIANIWRKKLIFDFDDATWIPNNSSKSKLISWLKAFWKVKYLCRWAYKVVAGNEYLAAYARRFSSNVIVIPTVIDTNKTYLPGPKKEGKKCVVGWTGSHSTLKYLQLISPVIKELQQKTDFTFLIIADQQPELDIQDWQFLPWNADSEIEDLRRIDIGVMPLTHDQWSEGKCGFKLIQYLGLGIPAVASPVGVNKIIVTHNVNGYHAVELSEWKQYLENLLTNVSRREEMGLLGREKIVKEYSLKSQERRFLDLFDKKPSK